jgi:glycosyltransferase involved in cell wall biosynthesis
MERKMNIKVILGYPFTGTISGIQVRYINLIKELAKYYSITVYIPGNIEFLAKNIPEVEIIGFDGPLRSLHFNKFKFIFSFLFPNPKEIFMPGYRYYKNYEEFVNKNGKHYDVSLYIGLFSAISYSRHDNSNVKFCDFCDSYFRHFHNSIKHSQVNKISTFLNLHYLKRIKRKFVPGNMIGIAITDLDRLFLQKNLKRNKFLTITNGIHPASEIPLITKKYESNTILFTGTLNYEPNYHSIFYCLHEIWAKIIDVLPNARFVIVGRNPTSRLTQEITKYKNVFIYSNVLDTTTYFLNAKISLAPMFLGGGLKNKILESLVTATPVVTNAEGAVGITMQNGIHGVIEETPKLLSEGIVKLFTAEFEEYERISKNCLLLSQEYHWSKIGDALKDEFDLIYSKEANLYRRNYGIFDNRKN